MPIITREEGRRLIKYIKSVDLKGDFWDPKAGTTFEFFRQMNSKYLKEINPDYVITFGDSNGPPSIKVKYTNGEEWSSLTANYKLNQLRGDFFNIPMEIDAEVEAELIDEDDEDEGTKKGDKGGGKKK